MVALARIKMTHDSEILKMCFDHFFGKILLDMCGLKMSLIRIGIDLAWDRVLVEGFCKEF